MSGLEGARLGAYELMKRVGSGLYAFSGDDETFPTARPPRRSINPYGGAPNRPGARLPGNARREPDWTPEHPPRRGNKWLLIVAVLLVIGALSVGGLAYINSLNTGGSTPNTVAMTPITPPASRPSYAFLRNFQVFVSVHGQSPQQMTNIPDVGQPNALLNAGVNYDYLLTPLLFSPDGRYVAALIAVVTMPADYFYFGHLYIIDTQTSTVTTPNSPGSNQLISSLGGVNGIAWVDTHTLLITGDRNNANVLAYDTPSGQVRVAFTPAGGALLVGSVVVRGHLAFYSELVPQSGSAYDLVLRQHDLNTHSDKNLFTLSTAQAPTSGAAPDPTGYVPFDISPDGARILWHGTNPDGGSRDSKGIWYGKLNGTSLSQLFATVDLVPGTDNLPFQATPLLAPDGKKALLTTIKAVYTINLDGSDLKTYSYPNAKASWLPDSSGITIAQPANSTLPTYTTFTCTLSTGSCSPFQDNAGPLYWSPV